MAVSPRSTNKGQGMRCCTVVFMEFSKVCSAQGLFLDRQMGDGYMMKSRAAVCCRKRRKLKGIRSGSR